MIRKFVEHYETEIRRLNGLIQENKEARFALREASRALEDHVVLEEPKFFTKLFNKAAVDKYEESVKVHEELRAAYMTLENASKDLPSDDYYLEKIEELKEELRRGMDDISVVIEFYKEHDIPIVLTERDKSNFDKKFNSEEEYQLYPDDRRISTLEDVMLVHKTNFTPINDEIGTRMSSNVIDPADVTIGGVKYDINLRPRRNTVHLAVNHEVRANSGGDWSNSRYAVIVPLVSVPKEQFGSNNCVDTFTEGKVELTEGCYILCPEEDIEIIKKENPSVQVIGFQGQSVDGYANTLLWILGYSVEKGNDWGFENTKRQNEYTELVRNAGYKSTTHHWHTPAKEIEKKNFYASFIVGVLELIMNNPEVAEMDVQTIINDSQIADFLYYCDQDTYELFNCYLSDIGLEPSFPKEGISQENAFQYCEMLVNQAKGLNNNYTV